MMEDQLKQTFVPHQTEKSPGQKYKDFVAVCVGPFFIIIIF